MAQSLSSAGESNAFSNSAARADAIRAAVRWLAEREAERKMINFEIAEYKLKHIRGDLGFKLGDWNAVYRVSQLEAPDRDALLECVREGFAALGIGQSVDWVDAAERTPRSSNGRAEPDETARAAGRVHGLHGITDYTSYPQGQPGHGDYELGRADGEAERERVMALGDEQPPKRRGRPPGSRNRPKQPDDAIAEFSN